MIGRSYGRRRGRPRGTAGRFDEQSAESAFSGRKGGEISRLYHCSILSSRIIAPRIWLRLLKMPGRARMPVEMGDAATSIVGRLITLSGCLPQATGVIRPPFIPTRVLPRSPYVPGPLVPPRNPKTDGPTSKRPQCDRITRYFHVRWLNWNATGDLRRDSSNVEYFRSLRKQLASRLIWFVRW